MAVKSAPAIGHINPRKGRRILGSDPINPDEAPAMHRTLLSLALLLPLAASAADNDIDKVNSAISIEAGQHAGNVSTVNGSVHIGEHAVVQNASTVNGGVTLEDQAQASAVGTVNGAITLGDGSHVAGKVRTTNGGIRLGRGAEVGGHLSTVNGSINLDDAHVAGGIATVSGDITVGAGSHVEGGILVEKPGYSWYHWGGPSRIPHVVIGPHAVVQGPLEFRREVVLEVSSSAQIGSVTGATPVKFDGAQP